MGILRKIADAFDPPETRTAWPPFNSSWLGGVTGGHVVNSGTSENLSTVLACVSAISSAIASLPAFVYRVTDLGREEDNAHPLTRIIRNGPNDKQTWPDFIEWLMASTLLRGNGLVEINVVFINGTIGWVIEKYLGHGHGAIQHKPSTQRNYRLYCDIVKREIGQFKIIDLTPVAVRAMRDSIAVKHKSSVADMCVMMVSALWKFAIEHERLPLGHNPAVGIFKLHKQKKLTKRWAVETIEKFSTAATPTVRLGLFLLLYTAQRESDVVTMQWHTYRGSTYQGQTAQDRRSRLDTASSGLAGGSRSDAAP